MIQQCFILKTGILSKNIGPDPDTLYPPSSCVLTDNKPDYPSLACQFDPPVNFAKSYKNMIVEVDAPKFANVEEEDKLDVLTPSMYDGQLRRDLRKDGGCYSAFTEVSEG